MNTSINLDNNQKITIKKLLLNYFKNEKINKITFRKEIVYLKSSEKNLKIIIKNLEEYNCDYYLKIKNNWELQKNINLLDSKRNKHKKGALNLNKMDIERLKRGVSRYIKAKSNFLKRKEFIIEISNNQINIDFYLDDYFIIEVLDQELKSCILYINDKKESEGDFDHIMFNLDIYFSKKYFSDELI
ncbi:hypothetical protein C7380_10140 [Oceanotoga teriensis]|uniref:Uncharacterized protein n=1 Tax=Oceanotoga teriensis TaxID=515440 RepID=A0AA45C929_9BACT|nr:hypothetical protein [Oceanotoga teriensis]PWJ96468.1 hypothetical protein C7380_10140 [Oceanotoga teriensis]